MEGIREHIRIQGEQPQGYESEVPVSFIVEQEGFDLEIFGRMDGIMESRDRIMVEEIKTCRKDPGLMSRSPDLRHLAQLKCYAYMAAKDRDISSVDLKLTYARPDTGETSAWETRSSREDLEVFFHDLISAYLTLLGTRTAWERIRNGAIEHLDFPFGEFRTGQRDLAEAVYKIIKHQKLLFARAPTGTGKTMATLFPAIKALGLGLADKIFYLTAKTPGRTVAEDALNILSGKGLRLRRVFITAKQKICFFPGQPCDMETCPYARAYYTKLAKALTRLDRTDHFDRDRILAMAQEFEICPFELSLDLSLSCDVIVCDLNYAFDPRVYLKRFFDRNTHNLVFLMDEAHNLPDRLRAMYSASLDREGMLSAQKTLREAIPGLAKRLGAVQRQMIRVAGSAVPERAKGDGTAALDAPDPDLVETLEEFALAADLWLENHPDAPVRETVLEAFFAVNAFLNISRYFDNHYKFMVRTTGETDVELELLCMDPAPIFTRLIRRCKSAVFFSATFFPFPFYEQVLLGNTLTPYAIALESPFPAENFRLIIHQGIKTTFRQRNRYYQDLADTIETAVAARPGNHLVFFPSYAYMDAVLACMDRDAHNLQVQSPAMDEEDREAFIRAFEPGACLTGFAVMGGIFGEGIDLVGERLTGVIVVGVGLPQVCPEQEEIRTYYDNLGLDGFFMAYQMPGFGRVLQAAGRLIRTPSDRGAALLIDERFMRQDYRHLFPPEWQGYRTVSKAEELPPLLSDL